MTTVVWRCPYVCEVLESGHTVDEECYRPDECCLSGCLQRRNMDRVAGLTRLRWGAYREGESPPDLRREPEFVVDPY